VHVIDFIIPTSVLSNQRMVFLNQ